jgi:predicted RNase H-like nuclease
MSDYILTYSKIKFYPIDPLKDDIKIEDIAHSLSLMTRANGHFSHFYSVAQHSVNCCKEAQSRGYSDKVQLGSLLHDASESYISDLTRPVKQHFPEYFVIEEKLQKIIYDKFGLGDLSSEDLKKIKDIDDAMLHFEFEALMQHAIFEEIPYGAMQHDFSQRDFMTVEKEFISHFHRLTGIQRDFECIGIDGCKGGWVAVTIAGKGFEIGIFKHIDEIISAYASCDHILIDMPIGLPENVHDLRPDSAARKILKGKASSIFNTPCRQAVYAETYSGANEVNRQVMGKGLSRQSFAICPKIKEIDEFLSNNPRYKNKLLESHPELCFAMLNSGVPILENKKTDEGIKRRIELLSQYYDLTKDVISSARTNQKLKNSIDDVIDALCLAVTGMVGIEKGLGSIPGDPIEDKHNILMQMVYAK